MARAAISEFGVIQKLLAGATVAIYDADENGESTGDLATLYAASTGPTQVSNPQTLDADGMLPVSCYVEGLVIAEISNISDLADRSLRKIQQNPSQFMLGATNAAYSASNSTASVTASEGYANDAEAALALINETFSGAASTTSLSIGSGSKAFTVTAGLPFGVGQHVVAVSDANPTTNYMNGQITAYSGTTLTVSINSYAGSGAYADWTIMISGPTGATGATGPAGSGSGDMLKSENLSGLANYATARSNLGLGSAAVLNSTDFATAAQGALADTAAQPDDLTPYMLEADYNPGTVLLATYTPSAAASVDITSILSSTYKAFKIEVINLVPSADNEIWLRVSTDNGSTWKSGASDYAWVQHWMMSVSGSPGTSADRDAADSQINLSGIVESSSGIGLCCTITVLNPLGTTANKAFMYQTLMTRSTPELVSITGGGEYRATTAVNALQILPAAGTITGTIKVYGVR